MAKNLIDNSLAPEKFELVFDKRHFETNFSIYILQISHNDEKYYFIENLNEPINISNKLFFDRLAQHFDNIASARNNDIFRFIANLVDKSFVKNQKFTDELRFKITEFLKEGEMKMVIYPLIKFDFKNTSKKEHRENSQKVRIFEKQVIRMFYRANKKLINSYIEDEYHRYDEINFPKIWEQIKIDFYV